MEPPNSGPSRAYGDAVPAVVRALDVLEVLQQLPEGGTLSELGRRLRISPSSMLAILRTLRGRGYVERDDATGVYRVGPTLARLVGAGAEAAALGEAARAVGALAQATVLEAAQRPDEPGARREALAALGLAARRFAGLLLDVEDQTVPAAAAPNPVWRPEASGPLGPDELERFLAGAWVATLSCLKENGFPYSVPVWYHWERGRFWMVPRARAEWARYLDRDPRVSLAIGEPGPPLRRALVEGRAEALTGPGSAERAAELLALMAARYLGQAAPDYLAATAVGGGRVFAIAPERLVTWRGLAPHPRYRPDAPPHADAVGAA